jgi:pilus assembly protein Flp/PilA
MTMGHVVNLLKHFHEEDCGATAVEYAVMLALIIVSVIGAIWEVSSQTGGMYGNINTQLEATNYGN